MKSSLFVLLAAVMPLSAQTNGIEEPSEFLTLPGGGKIIRWYAKAGNTYFLQASTQSEPLRKWIWAPVIEQGYDEWISHEVVGDAEKGFFRLFRVEQLPQAGITLENADYDLDGLSNLDEITGSPQTHPYKWDTDGDTLPDGWERHHGLNPTEATGDNGLGGDPDHDGLNNYEEFQQDTDPESDDTDGDGITDGGELDQGTDPLDETSRPAAEWVVVTGNLEKGVAKSRGRTVRIPAGQTRLVVVAVGTEEYPYFTSGEGTDPEGNPYLYNDTLSWTVTPSSGGQSFSDSIDINSRHQRWVQAQAEGSTILGMDPAYIEKAETYTAPPDADLEVVVSLSATNVNDGLLASTVMIGLLPMEIIPDYNRDGQINSQDRGKVSVFKPWRFWINDDDDSGEAGGDDIPIPLVVDEAPKPDYWGHQVDGVRDLVDFFPLHFDLQAVLTIFPKDCYQYVLTHETSAFTEIGNVPVGNFKVLWRPEVVIDGDPLQATSVGGHLFNVVKAQESGTRGNQSIDPNDGLVITEEMLEASATGKGIALLEANAATSNPLKLEIRKSDGTVVAKVEMPVRISGVEAMFRNKWLGENVTDGSQAVVVPSPANWPDSERNGKHFILVHGYNVSGEQARGNHAEFFKRLFWSGSNAMFTGVTWHGNESQVGSATPDYWRNVHNAFRTSASLKDFVTALPGASKHIGGHSLGNMVISSAIKDHGLAVNDYFMIDAAVALEAYSPGSSNKDKMSNPDWREYAEFLWSTEWHTLFPTGDGRRSMTWRDRFGVIANAYNFYSTGEEVLKDGDGSIPNLLELTYLSMGTRAWVKQEMTKGYSFDINGTGGGLVHDGNGGWRFNSYWMYGPFSLIKRTPEEMNDSQPSQFQEHPFFKPFANGNYHDPALGSSEAANYEERSKVLAEALPALSFAAGANPIGTPFPAERSINMMTLRPNGWPAARTTDSDPNKRGWLHGDIKDVAFLYTYKVYERLTTLGNLNQPAPAP